MELKELVADFRAWLDANEITDTEIEEGVGPDSDITTVTFPVIEEEGYLSYDIIASMMEGGSLYLYVEYCDIPDVDELELLRFVNDLNKASALSVTVEEGHLCFGYTLPLSLIADGEGLSQIFFLVWDLIDELRDEIRDAFGLVEESEE